MTQRQQSCAELLAILRAHESELHSRGVEAITLFGSATRGEATADSDIDIVFRPRADFSTGGFDHFGRLAALRERLVAMLGREVDLVEELAVRPRLRQVIEQEGMRAF